VAPGSFVDLLAARVPSPREADKSLKPKRSNLGCHAQALMLLAYFTNYWRDLLRHG
jgi:hypothetical protein